MQTIKTAVVVVMLLAVLYGGYVALNGTDTPLPPELEKMAELDLDFQDASSMASPRSSSNGFFVQSNPGATSPASSSPSLLTSTNSNANPGTAAQIQGSQAPGFNASNASNAQSAPALPGAYTPPGSSNLSNSSPALPPSLNHPPADQSNSPRLLASPGSSQASNASSSTRPSPFPPLASSLVNSASPSSELELPTFQDPGGESSNSLKGATSASANTNSPLNGDHASPPSLSFNERTIEPPNDEPNADSSNPSDETASDVANSTTSRSFENAKKMAMEQIAKRNLKEALSTLSLFYNSPELTHEQFQDLLGILDALAGEVIYSRNHYLELPHVVAQGESLEEIAKQYQIPSDILGKINAIADPNALTPGTKIKVVPGPFRAEVSVERSELTLFVGDLYAGRFAVDVGQNPAPKEGVFQVVGKQRNRNFYGAGGTQINGGDSRNPYGGWWIDLDHDLCIHGTPEQTSPELEKMGCISLSPIDAGDVFGMLSLGSKVQIRR